MKRQFSILFLLLFCLVGCQQEKEKEKKYTGEQVWIGIYDHPTDNNYTVYTLIYNSENKPPEIKIETYNEKKIKQKLIVRELSIIGKDGTFVILAPSDTLKTTNYNKERDALKFLIISENEAKITSYDGTFAISMERG